MLSPTSGVARVPRRGMDTPPPCSCFCAFQALTKFLKCVNWDLPQEAKQALELLGKWRPMDVEDSLELLSSQFTNPTVRRYAVARLQQADDEVSRERGHICREVGGEKPAGVQPSWPGSCPCLRFTVTPPALQSSLFPSVCRTF